MALLAESVRILAGKGYRPSNVDVVVVCERPKIAPVADDIRKRLADVLDVPLDAVSLKGKSNEGMGWIGSGEGLAVHAVALVNRVRV
jgi:2-C-methyl-D-erythritol 2,4-cyclodiphosphate synthase